MPMPTKAFAAPALLAALSLSATPAAALEIPAIASDVPARAATSVSNYGGGWGWGGRHRYRHRGRTTAGDVLGAVLVLGTIAAVANAASKANRQRSYPYPDRYPQPYPDRRGDYRPDYRPDYRSGGPQGLEGAADLCLREVERDARARHVTRVERSASGWLVTGEMADGAGFTCSIGADGRLERVEMGGRAQVLGEVDRQWDDERYRSARAAADGGVQPAYPGGPLPGEAVEDEAPRN